MDLGSRQRPPPAPAGAASPSTPIKTGRLDNDPGRQLVEMLNQKYNLGVPLAEGPQSPADKERMARVDSHFRRYNSITNLLRIHYYKEPHRLQAVLDDFDAQVHDRSRQLVRRPHTIRGIVPIKEAFTSLQAPRVEDRVEMQDLLLALLEASRTAMVQQTSVQNSQEWRQWKRTSPFVDPLNDRMNPPLPYNDATSTTNINRRSMIDRTVQAFARETPRSRVEIPWPRVEATKDQDSHGTFLENYRPQSPGGSSTSSAMYSAMDSFEEHPFSSQTTVYADDADDGDVVNRMDEFFNEDWYRSIPLRKSTSQESLAVSDSLLEAFKESCALYEDVASTAGVKRPESTRTAYSKMPLTENRKTSDVGGALGEPDPRPWAPVPGLWDRLENIFPPTPAWLQSAPFPIIWEMTRITSHCGVELRDVEMTYSPTWEKQEIFLEALRSHPQLEKKPFPEPSTQTAWDRALYRHTSRGGGAKLVAVYTILLGFNKGASGPLYTVHLQSICTDRPHRLSRRFGADRFLEILLPSHNSSTVAVPHVLRNHEAAVWEVNHWLSRKHHQIVGRSWSAFYTKSDGFKKLTTVGRAGLGKTDDTVFFNRVFLFAQKGMGISAEKVGGDSGLPRQTGPIRVYDVLDWLLQFNKFPENRKQPYLKLFSRIALGLSRTTETIVFRPEQIMHRGSDILSSAGKCMNDGVARMSLSVARKLRSALELSDLPVAVQGRIGSAKGMWILDTLDTGRSDWIETYPSQRKWLCDGVDADHRTLEVLKYASEARPAGLNLQFLPVLENRAIDKARMRCVLGNILRGSLLRDFAEQHAALENPLLFLVWAQENSHYRNDRIGPCHVPFLGGLPDRDEDVMQFLLAGGFEPLSQRYLWEKAYKLQKQRCKKLIEKLSIRVSRTAYLFMVVDFLGVLEEGEVQVCFSSKFQAGPDGEPDENGDDGSYSGTLLVGTDVLVARSPAHFASDIQKVRAVFRQELCALKDVIVFSSKGRSPLAEMLSGGDYDGDMAWVCWDPRIVDNFANAPPPPEYKLLDMGYMRKVSTTMNQLAKTALESPFGTAGTTGTAAKSTGAEARLPWRLLAEMVDRSFAFSMKENLLGKVTVYKEDLCYMRNTIGDKTANVLSTLLSDLVDRAKQGNDFTVQDFERLRVDMLEGPRKGMPAPRYPPKPAYKYSDRSGSAKKAGHIVDYLKFDVAKPIILHEMRALNAMRDAVSNGEGDKSGLAGTISYWDADLAAPAKDFEALTVKSGVCYAIFEALKSDIREVCLSWDKDVRQWSLSRDGGGKSGETFDDPGFRQKFLRLYQQWCDISVRLPDMTATPPRTATKAIGSPAAKPKKSSLLLTDLGTEAETIPCILRQGYLADREYSLWALIRASQAFRMLYHREIVWRLAGRQLQAIKAMMTGRSHNGLGGAKVSVTPLMYAALKPDRKIIKRMTARLQGAEVAGSDNADDNDRFASGS
ncbi:hypothetical protein SEPCBS57363_001160 [Sporothrix epigloea]|uniref:RNA-dependent RNA polymerase n=1 Tax=Sporothrix epigloea TaxID=1892477 RepID=A0ABP0D8Q0_9PEZI